MREHGGGCARSDGLLAERPREIAGLRLCDRLFNSEVRQTKFEPVFLVANQRRGSVNRSPQGAIRGGFAVPPQKAERTRAARVDAVLSRVLAERRQSAYPAINSRPR